MAVSDIVINQRAENEVRTEATVDLTVLEQGAGKLDPTGSDAPAGPVTGPNPVQPRATAENDEDQDDEDDELDDEDEDLELSAITPPANLIQIGTLSEAGSDVLPPELAWQERALCAQTDPEAFFPEKGGSTREAKRVCMSCEVRAECLDYALAKDERFGIWGGLSERERRRVKKQAV
jgi:WhiB family redox-sensing transcriptional regulator